MVKLTPAQEALMAEIKDALTDTEHKALDLTGELAGLVRQVIGEGPNAAADWAEAAAMIHRLQHLLLAQAGARAYPSRYRLLGQSIEDPGPKRTVHNVVAIPTLNEPATRGYLAALMEVLLADEAVHEILIFDNAKPAKMAQRFAKGRVKFSTPTRVINASGGRIYEMWNEAIDTAIGIYHKGDYERVNVAILNDDIVLQPGTIGLLAKALEQDATLSIVSPDIDYPEGPVPAGPDVRYCSGTYRRHGILGFCFMLRVGTRQGPVEMAWVPPLVDEGYEWWYGDDDLVNRVEGAGGRCGIVQGLPILHYSSTTANAHPWTAEAAERDRERYEAQWGGGA